MANTATAPNVKMYVASSVHVDYINKLYYNISLTNQTDRTVIYVGIVNAK